MSRASDTFAQSILDAANLLKPLYFRYGTFAIE